MAGSDLFDAQPSRRLLSARGSLRRQRQPDGERRAQSFSSAVRSDRAAVKFDQMTHNGEPKTQSAMLARGRAVRLPEAIKNKRQEARADALAGVADAKL